MAGSLDEVVPGELCHKSHDAQDPGLERYSLLLRLSRALASEESFHVRVFKSEGGPAERAYLPAPV